MFCINENVNRLTHLSDLTIYEKVNWFSVLNLGQIIGKSSITREFARKAGFHYHSGKVSLPVASDYSCTTLLLRQPSFSQIRRSYLQRELNQQPLGY